MPETSPLAVLLNDGTKELPLREHRTRRGLNLVEVATAIGLSQPQLSRLERGQRQLTRRTRRDLAQFYADQPIPPEPTDTEKGGQHDTPDRVPVLAA